ncbi:conserved membrane hypothetical protein [Candidatus Sulfopaludibacter sp. SbA3]|nr:conserved membrane hypothetical protein [Candidatus Sulfopaludibacter sp. SbA3]
MNLHLVGQMVRLRYKLMWAKTRSRNGKIALFVVGYLLLVLIMILLSAGGLGAAVLAVKSGQAEKVAQAVLGALYVQALFGTVMLGFGMNAVFADVELRRYPLTGWERRLTRHFIGIVDPFWFLILALELGLAFGLCALGDFNPVQVLAAILLLFVSNYILARVISMMIERLASRKSGSALLMVAVMILAFLPGTLMPFLAKNKANMAALLRVLRWTPPFGAAAAMTHSGAPALAGLGLVAAWLLGLAAVLVYLETLPPRTQAVQTTTLKWDSPFDELGAFFGPQNGPLMAFWLRFYARNNRFRALYGLSLPLVSFLTFNFRYGFAKRSAPIDHIDPNGLFLAALGAIFTVSFFGTSRFAVNQYGYGGGAFRRFFLLPTDPAASMRAGSYASMLVGSSLIPVAMVLWLIFGGPFDARKVIMLLGSAITGLFALHAAGLWVTLYGPRKGSYTAAMGNDMSLMGNLVVIFGMLGALFTPQVLSKVLPAAVSPDNWWLIAFPAAAALAFYVISLRATGTLFSGKREELLAVVEGRVK